MIKSRGIILSILLTLNGILFSQSYKFHNFSSDDGLPGTFVYSIIQDGNGYLWIGTDNGLAKYNGFTFENYYTTDSLADNFITGAASEEGSLWFGHMNGRFTYYDGKTFHPAGMKQQVLSPVTHFARSPARRLWASTFSDGIMELSTEQGIIKHDFSEKNISVITFDFLNEDELIVGTNTGLLLCRLNKSELIDIKRPLAEIPVARITCIQKMRNGTGFYVATENDGLFTLIDEENLLKVSKIFIDPGFNLSGIQGIFEDSQSNLWIASFGSGLIKITPDPSGSGKISAFNRANGFLTDNVKLVYEDREGIIWSGNYGDGLTRINPKPFALLKFDAKLYGNSVFSVYINPHDMLIGTDKGMIRLEKGTGNIINFFSEENGLPRDTVKAIYSSDGTEFWIGTEKNGLFRMKAGSDRIIRFPLGNGSLENSVAIITGKGDQVWVGTKKGLCNINSATDKTTWYSINNGGLPHNLVNSLYLDPDEKLWVSTKSGILAYIQNKKVIRIPLNSGSGILTLGPVTVDNDSRIWVGSNGNGLFMIESDTATHFTTKEGLSSDYCYSVVSDFDQYIWVAHKNGLSRIRTTDFSVKPIQHIEEITGDFKFNPNAVCIDEDKKIWFGTDRGLISYDPSQEYPYLEPPALDITTVRINGNETDFPGNKIILPPGNYKIRIDFLGISLKEPSLVIYQHKLAGHEDWSEISATSNVTYEHLTYGEYTFLLRAASGDGVVTENPLSLNIIIKKPIWKKWWFFPVFAIFLIALFVFYTKRRELKFDAEKKILEEKVRERTYEIENQKNEIEHQRDTIDEKNANITSSITYASNIQNAILPPNELLNKLFPDNFLLNKPKDIVSGDFYWLTEKGGKIVFAVGDCTGHGVPGAFMSILGITLLNEIVNIHGITRSDDIVTNLREKVIQSVQQERKDISTKDGMDISLCVLDRQKKKIQFTGAMNNMVYFSEKKMYELKADRFPVGVYDDYPGFFSMKEINYQKGDVFYLFSDGYKDQFGGDFDRKFLRQNFYLTLYEIHGLPMVNQKEMLEEKLFDWMKQNTQTDDITVMGIRI